MKKLFKILLIAALVIFSLLLIWALTLYVLGLGIQWWGKVMILMAVAVFVLIVFLIRRAVQKRREMKFVDSIIGSTDMPGNISALDDASRELRRRFKKAVSTLKKSDLKRRGNPLYVLPWYLIVGRSGAGKTTAIKSARLTSPFGDVNRVAGIEGTRNCDWWFFDDSVVIDIAGRYSVHRNEELDKEEWSTFLKNLVKYRKKEPINGIIVTVEADKLLEGNSEKIEEEGRTLRKRIEEVTSVMGAKFPVYLLVTKSDLIFGIDRYCRLMPESSQSQAMGLMNHDGETEITAFVDKTIDTISERLKDIRLILANEDAVRDRYYIEPEILLFPNEFTRLRTGLASFCKGAFKDNPFQELPFLRGIYFCSGCQKGQPIASQAKSLSTRETAQLEEATDGFFLYDFFAKILPRDRSLYSMTRTAKEFNRLTHNLWLSGFVIVVLIFCIGLTYAWNENKSVINAVGVHYKKPILFTDDPIEDIGLMSDFGRQIQAVEMANQDWNIPRMSLDASQDLEGILKKRYCKRFKEHFDASINRLIETNITNGGWTQDNYAPAIRYLPFVVRRINMIQAKFDGAQAPKLSKMPAPDFAKILQARELPGLEEKITNSYTQAYINYLVWQDDVEALNATLAKLKNLLNDYFQDKQGDLTWLAAWIDQNHPDTAITLNHFWHSNSEDTDMASITPAFTKEGRKLINSFVQDELEKAVENPLWIAKPKKQFALWYQEAFYKRWIDFTMAFGQVKTLFPEPEQWASVMNRLASDESPYLELLKTMEKQLITVDSGKWPSLKPEEGKNYLVHRWLEQVKGFALIQNAIASDSVSDNQATKQLGRKLPPKTKMAAKLIKAGMAEGKLAKGKQAYKLYQESLTGFQGIAASRGRAYNVAKAGFKDDPVEAKSSLYAGHKAINELQKVLTTSSVSQLETDTDPFQHLITEPINMLWEHSVDQAGQHIQSLWDKEVILKIEGVRNRHQLVSMLFGDKGYADKFVKTSAAPFLARSSKRGYYGKEVQGYAIPFEKSYFSFIHRGKRWLSQNRGHSLADGHVIDVVAFPTDVNIEARIKPHMTRLVLDSPDGATILENKQYPNAKKFEFSLRKSGNVALQIMLGDVTLTKEYTGYCAFGKFLQDFRNGKRTFTEKDFPEYRHDFARLGVTAIDVIYQLQADQIAPVVRMLSSVPGRPPTIIIKGAQSG